MQFVYLILSFILVDTLLLVSDIFPDWVTGATKSIAVRVFCFVSVLSAWIFRPDEELLPNSFWSLFDHYPFNCPSKSWLLPLCGCGDPAWLVHLDGNSARTWSICGMSGKWWATDRNAGSEAEQALAGSIGDWGTFSSHKVHIRCHTLFFFLPLCCYILLCIKRNSCRRLSCISNPNLHAQASLYMLPIKCKRLYSGVFVCGNSQLY